MLLTMRNMRKIKRLSVLRRIKDSNAEKFKLLCLTTLVYYFLEIIVLRLFSSCRKLLFSKSIRTCLRHMFTASTTEYDVYSVQNFLYKYIYIYMSTLFSLMNIIYLGILYDQIPNIWYNSHVIRVW